MMMMVMLMMLMMMMMSETTFLVQRRVRNDTFLYENSPLLIQKLIFCIEPPLSIQKNCFLYPTPLLIQNLMFCIETPPFDTK
jgi:hypothetical protein